VAGKRFHRYRHVVEVLFLKLLAIVLSFVFYLVVTRTLPAEEAGKFLFSFSLVSYAVIIAGRGLYTLTVRYVAVERRWEDGTNAAFVRYAFLVVAGTAVLLMVGGELAVLALETITARDMAYAGTLRILLPAVPALALVSLIAALLRGTGRSSAAMIVLSVAVPAAFVLAVLAFARWADVRLSASTVAASFAVVAWLVALGSIFAVWPTLRRSLASRGVNGLDSNTVVQASVAILVVDVAINATRWGAQFGAGVSLTPGDMAALSVLQKVAATVGIVQMVIAFTYAARISSAYEGKGVEAVRRLSRKMARFSFLSAIPVAVAIAAYPEQVLGVFGPAYVGYASFLVLLAATHVVATALGFGGVILAMTGNERAYRNGVVVTAVVALAVSFVCPWVWGFSGAVAALGGTILLQAVVLAYIVQRELRFNPAVIPVRAMPVCGAG